MDAHMYAHAFTALIKEKVKEKGLSNSEFGRRVFGVKSGARLWRVCLDAKRPRSITLVDMLNMAQALDEDFPSFVWRMHQEVLSRKDLFNEEK